MNSYFAPNEEGSDALLALSLLFQPWKWTRGKDMNNLKRRLKSRFFSQDTSISMYFSGRGALYQYLKSLNLTPEDQILLSPTCSFQTILTIHEQGLTPVFVDCDESLGMSIDNLEKKYHEKCSVLILDHPLGLIPSDRKEVLAFAKSKKLAVIEDVRAGFDLRLFKNKRYTSAVLWSFRPNGMISSVYGAALVVRGKKLTTAIKDVEKNIPQPSVITLIKILFYKIGSVVIKKLAPIRLDSILFALLNSLSVFPPASTKKEHQGEFDSYFLRIFPNVSVLLLAPQLDRFNDVMRKRVRAIKYFNQELGNRIIVPESSLPYYPILIKSQEKQRLLFKLFRIKKPRHIIQEVRPYGYTASAKKTCPVYESVIHNIFLLPTSMDKKQQKTFVSAYIKD